MPDALGYYNMPVPMGMGEPMLDFVGHYRGFWFAIETKDVGQKPTPRQELTMDAMSGGGGVVMWGDNIEAISAQWKQFVADCARLS